jgi:hypothetical protein
MGPFLGPFVAAFLAALVAGAALGLTRLSRRSLEWWRRRRAPAPEPAIAESGFGADVSAPAPFPGVHGAIACAVSAAALIAIAALGRSFGLRSLAGPPVLPPIALHPFNPVTFAPRALAALGFGAVALAATLVLALASSLIDGVLRRGLAWAFARVRLGRAPRAPADATLTLSDLRVGASGLWGDAARGGEPFGVGLVFVALFVTPVAAVALLLALVWAGRAPSGGAMLTRDALLLFGALFLAVPAAYAAAAERSQRDEGARLRRRAALRQLVAAPVWGVALLALGLPGGTGASVTDLPAWIVLACAVLVALPGATAARALLAPPRGGDALEPSAALRALTGLAHHGWLAAWAGFAALALVPATRPAVLALAAPGVLIAALAVRALAFTAWSRR